MFMLKEIRTIRNIRAENLANKVDLAVSTLWRYEKGEREPKYSDILKLAEALDVTVGQLMGVEEFPLSQKYEQPMSFEVSSDTPTTEKSMTHTAEDLKRVKQPTEIPNGESIIRKTGAFVDDIKHSYMDEDDIQIVRTMLATVDRLLDKKETLLQTELLPPDAPVDCA